MMLISGGINVVFGYRVDSPEQTFDMVAASSDVSSFKMLQALMPAK